MRTGQAAAGPGPAAPGPQAQGEAMRHLWTRLLALLAHLAQVCRDPEGERLLRGVGVRRTQVLIAGLDGEYGKSRELAARCGCEPSGLEVQALAAQLTRRDDLVQSFLELGHCYEQLLRLWAPPAGTHRHNWLDSRARVHLARAASIRG